MRRKKRHEYVDPSGIRNNINKYLKEGKIYIPYCVVSSKNSKKIVRSRDGRKTFLISSDAYHLYKDLSLPFYNMQRKHFHDLIKDLPKPIILGFHHIRYSKEKWDHHNMMQGPADIMQECKWIDDDDVYNVQIHPDGFTVDKENQGLIITPYSHVDFKRI